MLIFISCHLILKPIITDKGWVSTIPLLCFSVSFHNYEILFNVCIVNYNKNFYLLLSSLESNCHFNYTNRTENLPFKLSLPIRRWVIFYQSVFSPTYIWVCLVDRKKGYSGGKITTFVLWSDGSLTGRTNYTNTEILGSQCIGPSPWVFRSRRLWQIVLFEVQRFYFVVEFSRIRGHNLWSQGWRERP